MTGKIIGGMFGMAARDGAANEPPFVTSNSVMLQSARGGIRLIIDQFSPANVWLPSYFCPVMLEPLVGTVAKPSFIPINQQLEAECGWAERVREGDLVVLIDYFGFPLDRTAAAEARRRGAIVLEDASQALLSTFVGEVSDFAVYSPRKFIGVPDGGILNRHGSRGLSGSELRPPSDWWLKTFEAALLRRQFDERGGDRRWFELFQEVEREFPSVPYAMSQLSRLLLFNSFDYSEISRRRRENFLALADDLGEVAMFARLPDNVVPLGFPIRLSNRDVVRQALFAENIFPPVHWPLAGATPPEFEASHLLAAEIMTIPCDQRYDITDMQRIGAIISAKLETRRENQ